MACRRGGDSRKSVPARNPHFSAPRLVGQRLAFLKHLLASASQPFHHAAGRLSDVQHADARRRSRIREIAG